MYMHISTLEVHLYAPDKKDVGFLSPQPELIINYSFFFCF